MVEATHCVSNTIDFPEYVEAAAMMVPVVKSEWIQLSIARGKQCQVRQYSPDPRMIFSSVSLTCADIPVSDRETIIGALIALGGTETKDVTKQTTHICALTMDHPKCAKAVKAGLKCKIVLPHWFDDCFRLGRMIDEGPYLLPDPEILRAGPDEPVPIPQASQHLSGATSTLPNHLPHARIGADGERRPLTVFQDRAVMLGADLVVSPRLRSILEELITQSGGRVVSKPDDCDWLVCHYRDGADYVRASQCGKTVGNLAWLYHVVTRDEWSDPMHRLLHYPIPRNGIPGFEKLAISVSNYGGEARIYLENLITAAGGTFTKTMTKDNTHLVTARDNSEKCAAARDWGIAMVNHLWIEESYARCELQPLTTQKYTHFPPRTNLGEVIGQTYLDERRLRSLYFHGEPDNAPPSAKKARAILDQARANTAPRGPTAGVALGPPQPALAVLSDVGDDNMADARKSKGKAKSSGKHVLLGKENDTGSVASTTASRSAKDRALSTIHGLAEDLQLYEREKKRKGAGVPFGGTRAANQLDRERAAAGTRRKSDDISDAASEDDVDTASARRPAKKSRPSLPEVALRIAVTSYARWSGDMAREDKDRVSFRVICRSISSILVCMLT